MFMRTLTFLRGRWRSPHGCLRSSLAHLPCKSPEALRPRGSLADRPRHLLFKHLLPAIPHVKIFHCRKPSVHKVHAGLAKSNTDDSSESSRPPLGFRLHGLGNIRGFPACFSARGGVAVQPHCSEARYSSNRLSGSPHYCAVCRMHMVLRAWAVIQCAYPAHANPSEQGVANEQNAPNDVLPPTHHVPLPIL